MQRVWRKLRQPLIYLSRILFAGSITILLFTNIDRTVESYKMNTIDRVTLWHKNDLNWYDDEVSRFAFGWLISPREPIALHAVIEVNQAAPRGFACDRERLISTHSPIKQLKRRVVPNYPWRFSHRSVSIDGLSESERDDSPTGMRRVW